MEVERKAIECRAVKMKKRDADPDEPELIIYENTRSKASVAWAE